MRSSLVPAHHKDRVPLLLQRPQEGAEVELGQWFGGWKDGIEVPPLPPHLPDGEPVLLEVANESLLLMGLCLRIRCLWVVDGNGAKAPDLQSFSKNLDGKHPMICRRSLLVTGAQRVRSELGKMSGDRSRTLMTCSLEPGQRFEENP